MQHMLAFTRRLQLRRGCARSKVAPSAVSFYPLGVALAHPAERSLEVPRVPFRTGIPRTLAARPVTSKCCRQPRSAAACCPAACCWCGGSPAVGRPAIAVEPLLAAAAAKSHAPSPHLRRAARRTEANSSARSVLIRGIAAVVGMPLVARGGRRRYVHPLDENNANFGAYYSAEAQAKARRFGSVGSGGREGCRRAASRTRSG